MQNLIVALCVFTCILSARTQTISYPKILESPTSTAFFDTTLIDNYVSLEKINSPETQAWIKAQRKLSRNHLNSVRRRQHGVGKLNRLGDVDFNLPTKVGKNYFKWAYFNEYSSPGLFIQRQINSEPELFLDPSALSNKDEIMLGSISVSKDDKYMAFSYSRDGSDWREIRIKKMKNWEKVLKERIVNAKFTTPVWRGDGFYYLKYNRKDQFSPEETPELYYHKIGTTQEEDELIFRKKSKKFYEINFKVTKDERFLLIYQTDEAAGELTIYVKDFAAETPVLKPLFLKLEDAIHILGNDGDTFYALTGKEARNGIVVSFDLNDPKNWKANLPEMTDAILIDVKIINDLFVCEYIQETKPAVIFYDKKGEIKKSMIFEPGFSIGGFQGNESDDETIYYYNSYYVPPIVSKLDLNTFESELIEKTKVSFDHKDFQVTTIEYPSKDGTIVPLTVFSKKGMKLDGNNPLLLKTYGGFGSIHSPSFDEGLVFFLEKGGIFAYAHVRGEGNLGRDWVNGGRHLNKQNAIDDFISAAEFLIKEKYTNPSKLAITGGSHGGLMVGAAMVQRPDLFKVAVPVVGVFDMINAEQYTVGQFHKDEFGTVKNELDFYNLLSFSPYHQIKPGINYPTTLIMTSENDDRVPPFHSYKFAAKLQNNPGQKNPIFLRVEKNAGHYGATDLKGETYEQADMFSFILDHLKD